MWFYICLYNCLADPFNGKKKKRIPELGGPNFIYMYNETQFQTKYTNSKFSLK